MEINTDNVTGVLLADGWHPCKDLTLFAVTGSLKWPSAFSFRQPDLRNEFITGPASAILGLRTSHVESMEERFAHQQAWQAGTDAMFRYQHYTDEATYNQLAAAQSGQCAKCGTSLEMARLVHYFDGKLYCHSGFAGCSPLAPRWGTPAEG